MYFNIDFFNKEQFPKYIYRQFMYDLIVIIFGIILTYKTISPFYTGFSIFFLMFWAYFMHYLVHLIPEKINFHLAFHHNNEQNSTTKGRIVSFIVEVLTNIVMFVNLYIIQKLANYDFIPPILILYYGIIYVTVHNINYSMFHMGDNHSKHHICDTEKLMANFGPDSIDHLLGTNYDEIYEHFYHIIPNVLFSFLILYFFYNYNGDILGNQIK